MPNTAFASLIHVFFSQVVPALIIAGVACLLLRELLHWLERSTGRAFQSRRSVRSRSAMNSFSGNRHPRHIPDCPMCDVPMVKRSVRHGRHAGAKFWGCANYPMCRTTRPLF